MSQRKGEETSDPVGQFAYVVFAWIPGGVDDLLEGVDGDCKHLRIGYRSLLYIKQRDTYQG